jgi:hypothetical protein
MRSWRCLRPPAHVAIGVLAAFLTYTIGLAPLDPGGDPAWIAALHVVGREGRNFGPELTFQYGPLGFMALPYLYFAGTAIVAAIATFTVYAVSLVLAAWFALRVTGPVVATVLVLLVAQLTASVAMPERLDAVLAMVAVAVALDRGLRLRDWQLGALAAVAALALLVKLSTGTLAAGILGVTVAAVALRRRSAGGDGEAGGETEAGGGGARRAVAVAAGSYVLAVLVLWLIARQSLTDLPGYLANALPVMSGWSEAMALEEPGRGRDYVLAAIGLILGAGLAYAATRGRDRLEAAAVGLVLLGFTWVTFRHGFTRHDAGHAITFFGPMLLVLPAFLRRDRLALGLLVAAAIPLTIGAMEGRRAADLLKVSTTPAVDAAGTLLSGEKRARLREERRTHLRNTWALAPSTVELLRQGTTHYDSETGLAWAYQELPWRPLPMFQTFTTYTEELDELNVDFMRGDRAPRFIVRSPTNYDQREPRFESPGYVLELSCRYRQVTVDRIWQVLERSDPRCGEPREVESRDARFGEPMRVPRAAGRDSILVARFDEVDRSLRDTLGRLLFKPRVVYMDLRPMNVRARFIVRNGPAPHVLRTPACLDVLPDQDVEDFAVGTIPDLAGGPEGSSGSYRVTFEEIPFRCRPGQPAPGADGR